MADVVVMDDHLIAHHLYWYQRSKDDDYGRAGTPYYVGISSGPIGRRRFARHREDVPIPSRSSGLNIVVQTYSSVNELIAAERAFVQEWGRVGIDKGGVLLNRSAGGEFKLDSDWARNVKSVEGEWKRRYGNLRRIAFGLGISLPSCMKRMPDHWCRKRWGPCNKSKPSLKSCSAFRFWDVLAVRDEGDEIYFSCVVRFYEIKAAGRSLGEFLRPGVAIQALHEFWSIAQCARFLFETEDMLKKAD